MSFINLLSAKDLTGTTRETLEDAEKRWGFTPNILRAYALTPEVMQAEDAWYKVMNTLFLERRLKEAIATVVSAVNNCDYCSISHAHAYTLAGGDKEEAMACRLLDFTDFN